MNPGSGRRSLFPLPPAFSLVRSLSLPLFRSPELSSSPQPDQFTAVGTRSEAASEWRGKSKCAAVSGRGAGEAGLRGGRDLPRDGENEWGSGCRGRGGRSPEPRFILRSVLYVFRQRRKKRGGRPLCREGRPGWSEAEPLGSLLGLGRGWRVPE